MMRRELCLQTIDKSGEKCRKPQKNKILFENNTCNVILFDMHQHIQSSLGITIVFANIF